MMNYFHEAKASKARFYLFFRAWLKHNQITV
jgi:hypothetical protein